MYRVLYGDLMPDGKFQRYDADPLIKYGASVLGELPASGLSFSHVMNSAGSCSFTVPLPRLSSKGILPNKTAIYVERDGQIAWSGFLTGWSADLSAGTVSFECASMWQHLKNNYYPLNYRYDTWEQTTICGSIIEWSQFKHQEADQVLYGAWVVNALSAAATGVTRIREYEVGKNAGEAVEQMADVINGFTFEVASFWRQDGKIQNDFLIHYYADQQPPRARRYGINLVHGDNCIVPSVQVSGDNMVTEVLFQGDNEGKEQVGNEGEADYEPGHPPVGPAWVSTPLRELIPRKSVFEADSNVYEPATAQAKAEARADIGKAPLITPDIHLIRGTHPDLADLRCGDAVSIEVHSGFVDFRSMYQITEIKVEVSDQDTEDIAISVAPLELQGGVEEEAQTYEF